MASDKNGERQGFHHSLRSQIGYGAATLASAQNKVTPKTRKFISRQLLRTDTLMGITLKYGVTIQDLKKENKLWSNDHLFLRETLLIPLTPENENLLDENDTIIICDESASGQVSPSNPHQHLPNGDASDSSSASRKLSDSPNSLSTDDGDISSASVSSSTSKLQSTSSDFFAKYDSSIARLKGDVAKMEKNAANLEGIIDSNPLALPPRKGSGSSRRDSNSSTVSAGERRGRFLLEDDSDSSPVLLIRSRNNSRQVKSAIENLQEVNDNIYEL